MNLSKLTTKARMSPLHEKLLQDLQATLGSRYLRSITKAGTLTVFYRTKGNYYVKALYNERGEWYRSHYYHNWNEFAGKPFNYMFSRPALTSNQF